MLSLQASHGRRLITSLVLLLCLSSCRSFGHPIGQGATLPVVGASGGNLGVTASLSAGVTPDQVQRFLQSSTETLDLAADHFSNFQLDPANGILTLFFNSAATRADINRVAASLRASGLFQVISVRGTPSFPTHASVGSP